MQPGLDHNDIRGGPACGKFCPSLVYTLYYLMQDVKTHILESEILYKMCRKRSSAEHSEMPPPLPSVAEQLAKRSRYFVLSYILSLLCVNCTARQLSVKWIFYFIRVHWRM